VIILRSIRLIVFP